ncbi:hypothetical protein ON010_g13627 [Phytophthora cinnamomi]|nr:hypothetical protein ON010_g13627 [Phytophthora cinnamomi]
MPGAQIRSATCIRYLAPSSRQANAASSCSSSSLFWKNDVLFHGGRGDDGATDGRPRQGRGGGGRRVRRAHPARELRHDREGPVPQRLPQEEKLRVPEKIPAAKIHPHAGAGGLSAGQLGVQQDARHQAAAVRRPGQQGALRGHPRGRHRGRAQGRAGQAQPPDAHPLQQGQGTTGMKNLLDNHIFYPDIYWIIFFAASIAPGVLWGRCARCSGGPSAPSSTSTSASRRPSLA